MARKIYLVGLGPGGEDGLTYQARRALNDAEVLCGYTAYTDLAAALCPGKPVHAAPMGRELDRCRWALETAAAGTTVALVCSGDAGVYGMAGPLLELAEAYSAVEIEAVGGVTAALSCAALLGAPIGHDFCVVSLSDLLTPWEVIEKRLRCAAAGDFALCLYNPGSRQRRDHLRRACAVLLDAGKSPETVCGYVRNAGRPGQTAEVLPLERLGEVEADMFTTVFIGASSTKACAGRMVTPRGYKGAGAP